MQFFRGINAAVANVTNRPAVAILLTLLARLLMAGIFIGSGLSKLGAYAGTQQYMEKMGVAGALLPLVILTEVGGGLALLVGFQARLAALALAVFSVIAAVIFHTGGGQVQQIMLMMNLAMAGGLLGFVLNGAGRVSLDREVPKP